MIEKYKVVELSCRGLVNYQCPLNSSLIVIPALGNKYGVIMKGIYHAVLQINSSRPESGQLMFKRFRFTNSNKRIPLYIFNQQVDSLQNSAISRLPIQIIFPSVG